MKNVTMKVDGEKLIIEVDLAQDFGKSASGKTTIIASTCGNQALAALHDNIKVGVNIYKK